jgi:amidase
MSQHLPRVLPGFLASLSLWGLAGAAHGQTIVHEPTRGVPTFAVRDPVLRIKPGDFGGNMDASDVTEGATVYLPVFHEGGLFYFGDFHAAQGDGEITGSGLESTADVTFQFDLIKGQRIRWPRIENSEHIMVAGSMRPLVDAMRIAYVELIEWLVADYGFDKEAYQVASQVGVVRVANIVDPHYTVVAKFPKSLLPPKVRR